MLRSLLRRPRVQTALGLLLTAAAAGTYLALRLSFAPPPTAATGGKPAGTSAAADTAGPDLDADGKADAIRAGSGGLYVSTPKGNNLLVFETPVQPEVQVIDLGGGYPVLFAQTAGGENVAFAFAPGKGLMQALTWPDGGQRGLGAITADGKLRQAVAGSSGTRFRLTRLYLDKLQLKDGGVSHEPLAEPRDRPSAALAAAVEAVSLSLTAEMPVHFTSATGGEAFYARWHGKLPPGSVQVERADDVDAGAENGHTVPVILWVAGPTGAACLKGTATFEAGDGKVVIRQASLEQVTLKVASWEEATRKLTTAYPALHSPKPAATPFYGRYRFGSGGARYAVDALTGKVEAE